MKRLSILALFCAATAYAQVPFEVLCAGAPHRYVGGIGAQIRVLQCDSGYDWYVDSSVASGGAGTAADPFATIAELEAVLAEGDSVGVVTGSHWREQLTITEDDVTIEAVGTGAAPLFDASDIIAAESWSKTDGQTNVYEASLAFALGDTDERMRIWEDGTYLTLVADLATCDSTPGTYYTASHTTSPTTTYIHASDSSDPTTSGKVYEYPARSWGIEAFGVDGVTLSGIRAIRPMHGGGAIRVGALATIRNVTVEEGTTHGILFGDGTTIDGLTVLGWASGVASSQLILYVVEGASLATTITNVTLDGLRTPASHSGYGYIFYGHTGGNPAYPLGNINISNITATRIGSANISAGDLTAEATLTAEDVTVTASKTGIGVGSYSTNRHTFRRISIDNSTFTTYGAFNIDRGVDVAIYDSDITIRPGSGRFLNLINQGSGAVDVIINGCTITSAETSRSYAVDLQYATSGLTFTSTNNVFDLTLEHATLRSFFYYLPTTYTITSDGNTYSGPKADWIDGSGTYSSITDWHCATGQDANSTPAPEACPGAFAESFAPAFN